MGAVATWIQLVTAESRLTVERDTAPTASRLPAGGQGDGTATAAAYGAAGADRHPGWR